MTFHRTGIHLVVTFLQDLKKFFDKKFDGPSAGIVKAIENCYPGEPPRILNKQEYKVSTCAQTKTHKDGSTSRSTNKNWRDSCTNDEITLTTVALEGTTESELKVQDGNPTNTKEDKQKAIAGLKWNKKDGKMQPVSGTPLKKQQVEILAKKWGIDFDQIEIDEKTRVVTVKELRGKELQTFPGFENDGPKSWGSMLQAVLYLQAMGFIL